MATARTNLMIASALERSLGRLIRSPEGHTDAAAAPAAAAPADAPNPGNTTGVEVTPAPIAVPAKLPDAEVTAADLEAEFGGGDAPAPAASEQVAEPVGEGEEAAGAAEEPPVKPQTAEKRIAELVAANHEEVRKREAAEAEVARLKSPEPAPPAAEEAVADAEPDSANYEFGEADTQFIKDAAAHAAKMAVREEMAANAARETHKTQVRELETRQEAIFATGREKFPDFEEKVIKGAADNKFPLGAVATLAVLHSPVGDQVAYFLANNVEEAKRIDALTPLEQAREMGRLEARFETAAAAPAPARTTNAPPPPAHRARGEGGKFEVPDDTDDFKAFEAKADARMAAKR